MPTYYVEYVYEFMDNVEANSEREAYHIAKQDAIDEVMASSINDFSISLEVDEDDEEDE